MSHAVAGWLRRVGHRPLRLLIGVVLAAGGLWGFVELADEVVEGDTQALDRAVLLAMRSGDDVGDPLGPAWFEEVARDVTALGGAAVLTLLTVGATGYLLLRGARRAAGMLAGSIIGALAASAALKAAFDRPRPELVPAFADVYTASFPSGHAMLSSAVYLTLAAQLARVHDDLRVRGYLVALAMALTAAVGVSRVYLGVHWPTDVLAGWALGAAWAALTWLAVAWRDAGRRGVAEVAGVRGD